mgnify:FL=1
MIDADMVAARFEEAAKTEYDLYVHGVKPQEYGTNLPDMIKEFKDIYSRDEFIDKMDIVMKNMRRPSNREIDRMYQVWEWRTWLELNERQIVVWRSYKIRWKTICRRQRISRATAHRHWMAAMVKITHRLKNPKTGRDK